MESLLSHLITFPEWMKLTLLYILLFGITFGILSLSAAAQASEEENNSDKSKRSHIEYIIYFSAVLFLAILPFVFIGQKISAHNNIIKNKEYTLTKNGKILMIESKNQFLPSTELEIIHEDDERIQVKFDDNFYTIDKQSEEIKEK